MRVESLVGDVFVGAAVELVGAGFGRVVVEAASDLAELSGEIARLQ